MSQENRVKDSLNQFHRGRVEVKALTENTLFSTIRSLLNPATILTALTEIENQVITRAVESVEVDLNVNVPGFNPNFREMMVKTNFDKVKDMTDDLADALRDSLMEGWQAGEGIPDLKKRVGEVYGNGNITSARAEAIARTETNNLFNGGRLQSAKDSGLNLLKVWDAHLDSRTGSDSKALEARYLHNGILLDDEFYDEVNDQFIDRPPNRPNCRCRVNFVIVEDEVVSAEG